MLFLSLVFPVVDLWKSLDIGTSIFILHSFFWQGLLGFSPQPYQFTWSIFLHLPYIFLQLIILNYGLSTLAFLSSKIFFFIILFILWEGGECANKQAILSCKPLMIFLPFLLESSKKFITTFKKLKH